MIVISSPNNFSKNNEVITPATTPLKRKNVVDTREQAMTMIACSMDTTGLKTAISKEDAEKLLSTFKDVKDTASYAQQNIVKCIHAGLVSGRSEGLIAPKENITRAELAQITDKLLQKSQVIDH